MIGHEYKSYLELYIENSQAFSEFDFPSCKKISLEELLKIHHGALKEILTNRNEESSLCDRYGRRVFT